MSRLPNRAQSDTVGQLSNFPARRWRDRSLLKTREYSRQNLKPDDLVKLKKELVEKDCNGLIEFIESSRTLDDIH